MREDIAGPRGASSRPMWETLEGMVREKAQEFIQQIMEDSAEGYRNGYGKPRRHKLADSYLIGVSELTSIPDRIPAV